MALPTSPKSIIVKAGNQFSGYASNFNNIIKKYNTKICFVFILTLMACFLVVRITLQI